jgi:hypothetical protein
MMQDKYATLDGSAVVFDLDAVVDVVNGYSHHKIGWQSLIVYNGPTHSFVELRSSPPDYKGNSADESEEVSDEYVCENFQLEPAQLNALRLAPRKWKMLDRRV